MCMRDSAFYMGVCTEHRREKEGKGEEKTKIESDEKRDLLWKRNRHKRLPGSKWKSVNKVQPKWYFLPA